MSEIPTPTLKAMWEKVVDTATVKMRACNSTHGYVPGTSDFMNDISSGSFVANAVTLSSVTYTDGEFKAAKATISGVDEGETVSALIVYADTGTTSTSRILVFIDTNADGTPMDKDGNGANLNASGPSNLIAKI